jgi:hypothetical protein
LHKFQLNKHFALSLSVLAPIKEGKRRNLLWRGRKHEQVDVDVCISGSIGMNSLQVNELVAMQMSIAPLEFH